MATRIALLSSRTLLIPGKLTLCQTAHAHHAGAITQVFHGVISSNIQAPVLHTTIRKISTGSDSHQAHYKQSPDVSTQTQKPTEDVDLKISENIENFKSGDFKTVTNPEDLKHFRKPKDHQLTTTHRGAMRQDSVRQEDGSYTLPHPIWSEEEVHEITVTHKPPRGVVDRLALWTVKALRVGFDLVSGYNRKFRDERVWLNRICFLETVAGVPGMVAAMVRHLDSLRRLRRDHGWIHTLLEEAENERMHLMTAMQLKQPSAMFRMSVMGAQGMFVTFFSLAYLVSPRYCHRVVGYLEEEAVVTYTKCLEDMESGGLQHWKTQTAPLISIRYWNLSDTATMRDVILAIRADEAHHRVVNHTLASMKQDDFNPYKPGE